MIVIAGIVVALLGLGRYLRRRRKSASGSAQPTDEDSNSAQPTDQDRRHVTSRTQLGRSLGPARESTRPGGP